MSVVKRVEATVMEEFKRVEATVMEEYLRQRGLLKKPSPVELRNELQSLVYAHSRAYLNFAQDFRPFDKEMADRLEGVCKALDEVESAMFRRAEVKR